MTILQKISSLTADNGAVKALKDLLTITLFNNPKLEELVTIMRNVHNGDKLGFIGALQNIGWTGADCDPEYVNPNQDFAEKEWLIGSWSAPLKWCFTEFENTIAEYALKNGSEIGDITETEIMEVVIQPALEEALLKMLYRIVYFGDTNAKTVTDGGVLTDGTDKTLFTMCDGIFKHIFALPASQHTTIAANAQTTTATQMSAIRGAGVATGIVDAMIMDADSRIESLEGAAIYMTKSLADALAQDVKVTYKTIMPWEEIAKGVKVSEYNGYKVVSLAIWDRLIAEFQNDGTKLNLPHRAILGSPKNMLVGTPADKALSDVDLFFDKSDRATKAYVAGKIGTLLGEDTLFQVAY